MTVSTHVRGSQMTRRLDRPDKSVYIRLELDPATMPAVEDAAHKCRLSLASYCRLAIEMLSRSGGATVEGVRKEADQRLASPPSEPPPAKPKPRKPKREG